MHELARICRDLGALCAQLSHKPNQISARVTLFAALPRPDQWASPTLVMIVV